MTSIFHAEAAAGLPPSGRLADDAPAFEALFLRHYAGVHRLLSRVAADDDEAEDLAQEAFLKLYRHGFPAGREHEVEAWLYRVALNTGLNALRARRRRRAREAAADGPGPLGDPQDALARAEARGRARAVLARLDPRAALLLVGREAGLSYRELAAAAGVAPGSVGTLLARAERAFEAAYRQHGPNREEADDVR